jgi:hypothetical protein
MIDFLFSDRFSALIVSNIQIKCRDFKSHSLARENTDDCKRSSKQGMTVSLKRLQDLMKILCALKKIESFSSSLLLAHIGGTVSCVGAEEIEMFGSG